MEEIDYLKRQQRLMFARMGVTRPLSLDDYLAHEGFVGLKRCLAMQPDQIVNEVVESGLRGRGGAASQRASNGKPSLSHKLRRNTSSVTPTKVIRVLTLTA